MVYGSRPGRGGRLLHNCISQEDLRPTAGSGDKIRAGPMPPIVPKSRQFDWTSLFAVHSGTCSTACTWGKLLCDSRRPLGAPGAPLRGVRTARTCAAPEGPAGISPPTGRDRWFRFDTAFMPLLSCPPLLPGATAEAATAAAGSEAASGPRDTRRPRPYAVTRAAQAPPAPPAGPRLPTAECSPEGATGM